MRSGRIEEGVLLFTNLNVHAGSALQKKKKKKREEEALLIQCLLCADAQSRPVVAAYRPPE